MRQEVRVTAAACVAALCAQGIARTIGLYHQRLIGTADNSDGARLYRGTRLVPDTADGCSDWKGGVVVHFIRAQPGADAVPSIALTILRTASRGKDEYWCLSRLGWTYSLLTGGVAGIATWAVSAEPGRALALVPVLVPFFSRDFARLFVSTYCEPAGLVGAAALLCGTGVLASAALGQHPEQAAGLVLAGGGGLLTATAKLAYLPLLPVAMAVCAATGTIQGQVTAAAAASLAAGPVIAAWRWQNRWYPAVNAHNLIFTLLIPELGPDAAVAVGLPPSAADYAGHGSWDAHGASLDPGLIPGWRSAVGATPGRALSAARWYLARHPKTLARALGIALQATLGRDLDYLAEVPLPRGVDRPRAVTATGSMGHDTEALQAWLDTLPAPWRPSLLASAGAAVGVTALLGCPGDAIVRSLFAVAGTAAVGAVGIAALAILGDGYYEIAKHVWLSAYLLDVTAGALAAAAALSATRKGKAGTAISRLLAQRRRLPARDGFGVARSSVPGVCPGDAGGDWCDQKVFVRPGKALA